MIIYKLLFEDGTVKYLRACSYHDIDSIEFYINKHPGILHVDIIIPSEDKNYDND